jgi:hypothetical protein
MTAQWSMCHLKEMTSDDFSEAITVKVSEIDNAVRISSIEWGRP